MMTVLVGLICLAVGFYLGIKAGVWGTMEVLTDAGTVKRSQAFAKWIARRAAKRMVKQ